MSGMNPARSLAAFSARSSTLSASACKRRTCIRSAPKPLTTRMPERVSSTTPERSASSCCSSRFTGAILLLKRVAAMFRNGSAPSASNARIVLFQSMIASTPAIVNTLAAVSGIRITTVSTCWMSVFARAMSCPVWAWSWNAKCRRCRWAKSRSRRSVSVRSAMRNAV